jgi:hypothetical protein
MISNRAPDEARPAHPLRRRVRQCHARSFCPSSDRHRPSSRRCPRVVAVDRVTGDARLYYHVQIADEYQWYNKPRATNIIDNIIGTVDAIGHGEAFEIRGVSQMYARRYV